MKIELEKEVVEKETRKLGSLDGGDSFHFSNLSFQEALKSDAIYMVISGGKDTRVQITNISDGMVMQRDACHDIIYLPVKMVIVTPS